MVNIFMFFFVFECSDCGTYTFLDNFLQQVFEDEILKVLVA